MDRLHVATLNIRNLADRWAERLPLLLADMAALQPDLLGLQEVVYPMQQDRLIGAAGEGRYGASAAGPGAPSTATACWSASRSSRTRWTASTSGSTGRRFGRWSASATGGSVLMVVTHLHHEVDGAVRARPAGRGAARVGWRWRPPADAQVVVGDFNADPAEPAVARMRAAGFRSALRRGQRRRAGRHLAVRASRRRGWTPTAIPPASTTSGSVAPSGSPSARLVFDRPAVGRSDALPERPPRARRPARARAPERRVDR